jgi:pyruvate formate lyase activating enzyme
VLFDLKHLDPAIHRQHTGVSNLVILKNLEALLQQTRVGVWIRIPVIPSFNFADETIAGIGAYLRALPRPVEKVSLLPFHQYGAGKYAALGRPYRWLDQSPVTEERIEELRQCLVAFGLQVEIGR